VVRVVWKQSRWLVPRRESCFSRAACIVRRSQLWQHCAWRLCASPGHKEATRRQFPSSRMSTKASTSTVHTNGGKLSRRLHVAFQGSCQYFITQDLRYSLRWLWRISSSRTWCLLWIDVSEERVASIFRVEEITRAKKTSNTSRSRYFYYPQDGGDTFFRNVGLY
jgi:hypothetical protein